MEKRLLRKLISKQFKDQDLREYLLLKEKQLGVLNEYELRSFLMSDLNYMLRCQYKSSELVNIKVKTGDICFIDFNNSYLNEAGFQHFGLILGKCNSKIFVVPMSSNQSMYYQSYCEQTYPVGKKHLFRLPRIKGLHQKSVLFINDAKFINSARVIAKKAYIDPKSSLFKGILKRVIEVIIDSEGY